MGTRTEKEREKSESLIEKTGHYDISEDHFIFKFTTRVIEGRNGVANVMCVFSPFTEEEVAGRLHGDWPLG